MSWRRFSRVQLPFIAFLLFALALAYPAVLFAAETGDTASSTLIAGCEKGYPPFCFVDEGGTARGFSVELLRAALAKMDYNVEFRTGLWPEVKSNLADAEIDVLPLVGRTPEREAIFDFTFPYMPLHGAIIVREASDSIRNLDDLRGREVAVMEGDNAHEFLLRKERGIKVHPTSTFRQALAELAQGKHDAVLIQRLLGIHLLQKCEYSNLRVVDDPVTEFRQDFCFAVTEGDDETLNLLNEGLALIMADGTFRRLHTEWFAQIGLPSQRPIIVGGDHNYPPFEFLNKDGRPAGYNVDVIRAIAKELNLAVEIRLGPWVEIMDQLEKGEIDVVQGMYFSSKRNRDYDFTQPHRVNHYVCVTRKSDGPPPRSIDQLHGKHIVVQRDDIIHGFAKKHGIDRSLTAVESQEEALRQLNQGKYDCALVARLTALYLINHNDWRNLNVGNESFLSPRYAMAVQEGDKALLATLGEGLRLIDESGEYQRIQEKWTGIYKDIYFREALRYSILVIAPIIVLLLILLVWWWFLRRLVRRRTAELRKSEEKFRKLFENAPVGIFTTHSDGRLLNANDAMAGIMGFASVQEALTRVSDLSRDLYEDPKARDKLLTLLRENGYADDFECCFHTADERRVRLSLSARISERYDDGSFIVEGFAKDITAKKEAEERVVNLNKVLRAIRDVNQLIVRRHNRETLIQQACRLLVENKTYMTAMIILIDEDKKPDIWSYAGDATFATPMADITVRLERGELPPCLREQTEADTVTLLSSEDPTHKDCSLEPSDDKRITVIKTLSYGETAFGYLIKVQDILQARDLEEESLFRELADDLGFALHSLRVEEARERSEKDREKLQRQFVQIQKMEAVGRLAGGVAHDFNNMLSVIIGTTELMMAELPDDDPLQQDLREIMNASQKSVQITGQLLAFARKQNIHPVAVDINEVAENSLKMLRRLIGEDIDLQWLPSNSACPTRIDPSQIDQILANLCVNARDAIKDVGKITIETSKVDFDEEYCAKHAGFTPGPFVMLAVTDDGCGMEKATLENLFEPFYTTKDTGKGTGLGLATVYGIVKQNNGYINVYSEPGEGTTFKIYLPRINIQNSTNVEPEEPELPVGRGETLLLAEDNVAIMRITKRVLEKLNYHVLAADTPTALFQLAQDHPEKIHVLITDVIMPEMNGRELAMRVQKERPDLEVLYMSGYTANVIAHHGVLEEGVEFLQKPFSKAELASKIRELCDGNRLSS